MDEITRQRIIEREYIIPSRLFELAEQCPHVTWYEANKLYQLSVEETKIFYSEEHIVDIPWGKGLLSAQQLFVKKIKALENVRVSQIRNDQELKNHNYKDDFYEND